MFQKNQVELGGGLALGDGVAGAGELAGVPAVDGFEVADGAVEDEFAEAFEVGVGVALGAVLGGDLRFVFEVVGADGADLFDGDAEGFFAEDVFAAVDGPVGDEGVVVVGGADYDGVNVLLIEALAPVVVGFGFGEDFETFLGAEVVDVAEGDDVFIAEDVVVGGAASPDADEGDVEAVAGGGLAAKDATTKNGEAGGGLDEFSALHAGLIV
ncbi:MAG: hypothetical protein NTV52_25275 [Acidobacteria bacterium]|nr:hypothetical protein [Acidobacteriota bacterium]